MCVLNSENFQTFAASRAPLCRVRWGIHLGTHLTRPLAKCFHQWQIIYTAFWSQVFCIFHCKVFWFLASSLFFSALCPRAVSICQACVAPSPHWQAVQQAAFAAVFLSYLHTQKAKELQLNSKLLQKLGRPVLPGTAWDSLLLFVCPLGIWGTWSRDKWTGGFD